MKLRSLLCGITTAALLSFILFLPAAAMDDPGFEINRMVMSTNIADREPVGAGDSFAADTEKIYCFLEARNIEQDTMIRFVWYHDNREMARVTLPIRQGRRWRTYSSKKLAGLQGGWKVELEGPTGIVLHAVSFQVR